MTKALLFVTALCTVSAVHAEDPENYIKYRQAMMKAIAGHSGAASQIVRGKVSPDGALAMHADALAKLTVDLPGLFPDGSDFGETKAKEEIWSKRPEFEKAADDARKAAAAFDAAVKGGDAEKISAAYKDLGETCKGCHKEFRQKDD